MVQTDFNLGNGLAAKAAKSILMTQVPGQVKSYNLALRDNFMK
jgi:hypothetical protein